MTSKLTLFLIVSAIILAMGVFSLYLVLNRRPDPGTDQAAALTATAQAAQMTGEGLYLMPVDNTEVTVKLVFGEEIRLLSELTQPQIPESQPTVDVPPQATLPPEPTPFPTEPPATIAPTATFPPVVPAPVDPIIFVSYTVQSGDNLFSIADRQNSSISLMSVHGIDANDLTPGTVINRLPVANPAYCPGYRAYVVREGDTTYSLAHRFGTTHQFLRDLNNLSDSFRINVAQVICVP